MGKYVWRIADTARDKVNEMIVRLGFSRPLALYLAARGVNADTADIYLNSPLKGLSDPYVIPGIEQACERLWRAVRSKEKILIHGDYDVDGITSAGLLHWVLSANGGDCSVLIPHRFDDGYGFTKETLEKGLLSSKFGLVVTVDCGISSFEAVDAAKKLGIDVIITDHHETQNGLPDAYVIVNPKLDRTLGSLHILSGVGIAFKLGHGFIKYGRARGFGGERFDLKEGLDLVALGTVADIVPLTGENRILVKQGLKVLSRQHRPGVMALCEAAGCQSAIKSTEITFALAPRINAAGRLGDPLAAFNLLTSSNIVEASHYAQILNDYNKLRQEKEDFILNEAAAVLDLNPEMLDRLSIVLWGKDWHQGVIGIVASRLSKLYNRPAIIFSIKGDIALGSGRSVTGLNLIEILSECSSLLDRFGGHPMAAGLSMKSANLPEFMESFEKLSRKNFEEKIPPQALDIDGEIEIGDLDAEFFSSLENLEPFGHSNSQPLFLFKGLQPTKLSPAAAIHSRGYLRDYKNSSIQFIAFNRPLSSFPSSGLWDVVATPSMNNYNGTSNRQLQIVDVSG